VVFGADLGTTFHPTLSETLTVTIQGVSDGVEKPRDLDIDVRSEQCLLWIHPPGKKGSGQKIVPNAALLTAIQAGNGHIDGASPVRGSPKKCLIERRPEGLRVQIYSNLWREQLVGHRACRRS